MMHGPINLRMVKLYLHSDKHINRVQYIYRHGSLKRPTELERGNHFFRANIIHRPFRLVFDRLRTIPSIPSSLTSQQLKKLYACPTDGNVPNTPLPPGQGR